MTLVLVDVYAVNMDLKNKNLSLQFYNYSCNIVGSEEDVRSRRDIFFAKEIVENTTNVIFISSGSKAEGLDLKGSDYDMMILPHSIRVYENLNYIQSDPDKSLLVMDTKDTKPGFTKLKVVNKSDIAIAIIHDCGDIEGKETYISSKRFREHFLRESMIIHGPCVSTQDGVIDQAFSVRCKEWITPAQQWIHRSRTEWPHYTLVTAAVQYGVLFVPIGCKNSPNENLQWRISFSVTEKMLIHSFSHTQLLCYALLKIILKDIVKPMHGDLLCSYFLKTIMFWLSEEIDPSKWKPDNMISCFLDCIRRLIYYVEYKTCLHYFIPENNLFADRFTEEEHKTLMYTLNSIYESPWSSVFHTETFLSYRLHSVNSHSMAVSASALSCFYHLREFNNPYSIHSVLKRFENGFNHILKKEICAYTICECFRKSVQDSDIYNLTDRNKSFYKKYMRIFVYFKIRLQSDSVSSWLLIASLFYKCKRFLESLDIINYCLTSCTPDKIYLFDTSLAKHTVFKQMKQKLGLLHAFKYFTIEDIYFEHPFYILPDELIPVITDKCLVFPPVVYSYLLQLLCCHHLGDYRGKQNALHDLELTIRERYFIRNNVLIARIVRESLNIVKELLL